MKLINPCNSGGASGTTIDAYCYVVSTTGTPVIQKAENVSSITDTAVGIFALNFTTALASANYSVGAVARTTGTGGVGVTEYTTSGGRSTTFYPFRVVVNTTSVDENFSIIILGA